MTATAETVAQEKTVEQLVIDYQQYCERRTAAVEFAAFNILQKVKSFKAAKIHWLRKNTPQEITLADLHALFDDSLLEAMNSYKQNSRASFYTYVSAILLHKRTNAIIHLNSKKHVPTSATVSISEVITEMYAVQPESDSFNSVEAALIAYSQISDKTKASAAMLCIWMQDLHGNELLDRLKQVFPAEKLSNSCIRKRLQRARADFKQYYTEMKAGGAL
ncbi:hypothetical protein [Enterococcus mediterraneensis]|uniref:hypothetical protein n=1 Tax=Enterococcus mediterraneensis TaxID=2364791 RepID=UPI000F04A8AD|nr:hypothetical protein [Enterococcus mediterraneensis]